MNTTPGCQNSLVNLSYQDETWAEFSGHKTSYDHRIRVPSTQGLLHTLHPVCIVVKQPSLKLKLSQNSLTWYNIRCSTSSKKSVSTEIFMVQKVFRYNLQTFLWINSGLYYKHITIVNDDHK